MTTLTLAAKLLTETTVAALVFTLWRHVDGRLVDGLLTSLAAAWYLGVLGTILTGYLFFVVGLGMLGAFLPSWRNRSGAAFVPLLCFASMAYVGVGLLLTRINEATVPIALGLVAGNILFMAYHFVRQGRVRQS